jgi:hypothetical protein
MGDGHGVARVACMFAKYEQIILRRQVRSIIRQHVILYCYHTIYLFIWDKKKRKVKPKKKKSPPPKNHLVISLLLFMMLRLDTT